MTVAHVSAVCRRAVKSQETARDFNGRPAPTPHTRKLDERESISAAAHRCFTQQTLSIILIVFPLVRNKGTAA